MFKDKIKYTLNELTKPLKRTKNVKINQQFS